MLYYFEMKIKFVYFDLGGVAFHFHGGLKELAKKYSIQYQDLENVYKRYDGTVCRGEISAQELWEIYKNELTFSDEKLKDFAEYWVSNFEPIKETQELMLSCVSKYKIGILTNIYKGVYSKILEMKILPDINWDAHTHSCDIGFVKPEIEIYQIATEKAKTNPEEILFIDDNNNFIEGAKKIGWQTFLFDEENPRDSVFQLRTLLNLN